LSELKLIVGLGNPGEKYTETRHNLGFMVVQSLLQSERLVLKKGLLKKSVVAEGQIDNQEVRLLLPLTFMNLSGQAVKEAIDVVNIDLLNILINSIHPLPYLLHLSTKIDNNLPHL